MTVLRKLALFGAAALGVSGCSSSGGSSGGDGANPTLHSYTPTYYQDSVTLAQARAKGMEGLAINADGDTIAKVTQTEDRIQVSLDGKEYDLVLYEQDSASDDGYVWSDYGDEAGNRATMMDGQYSGFAAVVNGDSRTLFVTGQETRDMPSQTANYQGPWATASGDFSDNGFRANADFDAQRVDYTVDTDSLQGAGQAGITGSQFEGGIDFDGPSTGSGTVAGAFYGPQADEIGGVSSGTIDGEHYDAVFHGRKQ